MDLLHFFLFSKPNLPYVCQDPQQMFLKTNISLKFVQYLIFFRLITRTEAAKKSLLTHYLIVVLYVFNYLFYGQPYEQPTFELFVTFLNIIFLFETIDILIPATDFFRP